MSFHTDDESWLRMCDPRSCPACQNEPMPAGMVDEAELSNGRQTAEPCECLRGACHQVARRHAIKLYDLSDDEPLTLMKDAGRSARALKRVTGALKITNEFDGRASDYSRKINQYPQDGVFGVFTSLLKAGIEQLESEAI